MKIRSVIRNLYVTHVVVLLVGVVITMAVILSNVSDLRNPDTESVIAHFFMFFVPLTVIVGLASSIYIKWSGLKSARSKESAKEKVLTYANALSTRDRFIEAMMIISILALMATGFWLYLATIGLLILVMYLTIPGKKRIQTALDLSDDDLSS